MPSKKKPLISILTPSWNREKYLKKLTKSLEKLKYKNFEWIIGNDGSTDNTDKIIRKFAKKKKFKIKYLNSNLRIGKSKMENKMLDVVSGKYMVQCDSDDYLLPNSLNKLINLLPSKNLKNFGGICGQNLDTNGKSQTFFREIPKRVKKYKWENLRKVIDGDGTLLVPKKLFKNKRYLEVDFLITESSLLNKVYAKKIFILTPQIIKIMDRRSANSVSFGKKLSYTRGSFYCLIETEKHKNFIKKKLIDKIKIVINFWRYSIHGDINFSYAFKKFKPIKNNLLYIFLYPISLLIVIRDILLNRIEKTHIDFEKNKNKAVIKLEIFS